MRKIKIISSIAISDTVAITFTEFITKNALHDLRFGKSVVELRLAREITQALTQPEMLLSDEAWALLAEVVSAPLKGYQPQFALPLLPFMESIVNAEYIK